MHKTFPILLVLIFCISCSSDDDAVETFVNPNDVNLAIINYDGLMIPNDTIPPAQLSASYCCEDIIRIRLKLIEREFRGHVLDMEFTADGQILKYHTQNDFFNRRTDLHFNPYFYIPEDFYEIAYFNFNPNEEKLDLKAKVKLLKEGTYLEDGETIEVETELEIRNFTECSCGRSYQTQMKRGVNLSPEIKFSNFSTPKMLINQQFVYSYPSTNINGYYLELKKHHKRHSQLPIGHT